MLHSFTRNYNDLSTEAGFAPYEYYSNGEIVGVDINSRADIISLFQEYNEAKQEYDQIKNALKMALELMKMKKRFPHTAKLPVQNPNEEGNDIE